MSSENPEQIVNYCLNNLVACVAMSHQIWTQNLGLEHTIQADSQAPNSPFTPDDFIRFQAPRICSQYGLAIHRLDITLQNLEYLTSHILTARSYAEAQITRHMSLLSPIRRLPVELLQLIFCHVHAATTGSERDWPVVARVCSFWRKVAHATPALWRVLEVDVCKYGFSEFQAREMHERILRANVVEIRLRDHLLLPLVNKALYELPANSFAGNDLKPIVNVLLMYSNSIKTLTIPTNGIGAHIARRYAATGVTCDNLRKLRFSSSTFVLRWENVPGTEDYVALLCNICPNLEHLEVNHVTKLSAEKLKWGKLKQFQGYIVPDGLRQFLSGARLLKDMEISSQRPEQPPPTFQPMTQLQSLRVVEYGSRRGLPDISGFPRMPALRHFAICRSGYTSKDQEKLRDENYLERQVLPSLKKVGSTLVYLALDSAHPTNSLKDIFKLVPNLQGLRFMVNTEYPCNLLSRLTKITHLELEVNPTAIRARHARKIFFRGAARNSSEGALMNKRLESVAFYSRGIGLRKATDVDEEAWRDWKNLIGELRGAGVRVRDYRVLWGFGDNCSSTVPWAEVAFNTDYFKDKGVVVGF